MTRCWLPLCSLVVSACSQIISPAGTSKYHEDLSLLIPDVDETGYQLAFSDKLTDEAIDTLMVVPSGDITYEIDSLLDSIASNDQKKKFIQGYTIQVYTGGSRSEANFAQTTVYRMLPGSRPTLSYDLPNYKVKVGKFLHRIQAQKDFDIIKNELPAAILVPQQFAIDK